MSTHAENVAAYRDTLIANAVTARKIAPDREEDYRKMFDANPAGVANLLTAPVEQGGLMAGLTAHENPVPTEYPKEWLGQGVSRGGNATFEDSNATAQALSGIVPQRALAPAGAAEMLAEARAVAATEAGIPVHPRAVPGVTIEP